MSSIISVSAVVCTVAVACSIVTLIVPQGSTKRVINAVVGVFIICCMILPVKNAVSGFTLDFHIPNLEGSFTASSDEAYEKAVLSETKSSLESSLVSYLLSKNYKVKSAEITLNSKVKSGIYIESICIYIDKSELKNSPEIISLTEKKFETTPELLVT
ncbi:MAG: stage III sporulation protein AF [Ruminococcus sp.]|nr:stage III sporulation protein AF [Ruminococcus sp.]